MAEREQKSREEDKRLQEQPAVPRGYTQFNMLLSRKYPRYQFGPYSIPVYPALVGVPSKIHQQEGYPIKVISLEPAMNYLWEKYNIGQIPILDDETYNRLVEFAKDGETMPQLLNRLLDIAESKK